MPKDARYTVEVEVKVWDDRKGDFILTVARRVPCSTAYQVNKQLKHAAAVIADPILVGTPLRIPSLPNKD